ncbi:hypothetical protein MVEN_00098300 [Mycena venus]|uniref:DUF6534 domain-containing protein n=1 Tax=Mycena venus TaxID=2733690 RepID=A0A8H6Z870_9AGAR|nr:hypothetical protein MVEN_00098300 [Mycena venus]
MSGQLHSTYGAWFIALALETLLYGFALVQTWINFQFHRPADRRFDKWIVPIVIVSATTQVVIWADTIQLIAGYLTAVVVQMTLLGRIYELVKVSGKLSLATIGVYTSLTLALVQIVAGIGQAVQLHVLGSYLRLSQTTVFATVQSAASFVCDLLTATCLCFFLRGQKGEFPRTRLLIEKLISDAIKRGMLTSLSSGVNMVLFLVLPDTFWYFLGSIPLSPVYMITLFAWLNSRQRIREEFFTNGDVALATLPTDQVGAACPSCSPMDRDNKTKGNANCGKLGLGCSNRRPTAFNLCISCWMTLALVAGCIDCGKFGFRRVVRFAAGIHAGSSKSESAVCPQPPVSNAWGGMPPYAPTSSDDESNNASLRPQ